MAYVADLHIHSRFSRACSGQLNVPNLSEWAKRKGINLMGTGDMLHPLWLAELKNELIEDGTGFLTYTKDPSVKFLLTVEIATMYSHKGKGRRLHNLVFMPDFASVEAFQKSLLARRVNIASDGRPILGMSSKDLLSLSLQASDKALFILAHAWTPWFGIFGSESGYDSLEECFEDMTPYIYGIETGLSSDPAMNWRIKELDTRSILSFSDAHSLPNLGREATVFAGDLSSGYLGMYKDIKEQRVAGTIEFYPEEGKYHFTGHRNCNVKYSPEDTKLKGKICPVCNRGLTVGVMERVEEIATRSNEELKIKNVEGKLSSEIFPDRASYKMLVPLLQIIAETFSTAPTSQRVINEYKKLIAALGSEIKVLTKIDIVDIAKVSGPKVAEGVLKMRKGDLVIDPGYDGVYGVVKIWREEEEVTKIQGDTSQLELFS